ncbi:tumor necrosis factor ligand superfamily member 6 [Triplophysa rosa]|uniref:Fas ligand n=1 Tax=Triplophysa rosa TaxID=992332 RepID=A0A9W7WHH2_TRIRA|nr:tumor necrosis factor ligand superfamily member 6 [Triplophysa rosa]KAI7799771.1 Fas ligand [Triplophysa rosa]
MSSNLGHSSPPLYTVDSGGGHTQLHRYYHQQMLGQGNPPLVPCWTFPPARAEMKRRGWGTMSTGMTWVLTLILLLVFAALGLGTYQILRLQTEVERLTQEMPAQIESVAPQRQVGMLSAQLNKLTQKSAAHVIGCADQSKSPGTLKWEATHGEVFTNGIKYSNGGLQVNETGLYFVYSRVEFLARTCKPTDSLTHMVIVSRNGRNQTIMEDHKEGFCMSGGKQVWMTGSHLSSLQHLKQSDWLFVNVSHPHLLSKNFHYNYFGLFKIH